MGQFSLDFFSLLAVGQVVVDQWLKSAHSSIACRYWLSHTSLEVSALLSLLFEDTEILANICIIPLQTLHKQSSDFIPDTCVWYWSSSIASDVAFVARSFPKAHTHQTCLTDSDKRWHFSSLTTFWLTAKVWKIRPYRSNAGLATVVIYDVACIDNSTLPFHRGNNCIHCFANFGAAFFSSINNFVYR